MILPLTQNWQREENPGQQRPKRTGTYTGTHGLSHIELDADGWDRIEWRACEEKVRRLWGRIFTAAQEQDWPKVRNLQKLMVRPRCAPQTSNQTHRA
jgi:hypothetical protein